MESFVDYKIRSPMPFALYLKTCLLFFGVASSVPIGSSATIMGNPTSHRITLGPRVHFNLVLYHIT